MGKKLEGQWAPEALIGGHPALDFVNTAGGRTKSRDVERLLDYGTLLRWSEVSKMLPAQESRALQEEHFDEDEQRAELRKVRKFREALHTCLMAEQSGSDWPD